MCPIGISGIFSLIEGPYAEKDTISNAPVDDWKWQEGRPPSYGSPLIPFIFHSWDKMKWAAPKIVPPKLSFQGINTNTGKSQFYTMHYVNNNPTFITDHHVISLRKMIEQLWAPKFHAHIHLELEGEIFVKPLYSIGHGAFKAAQYYEWLESIIPPTNPNKPYKLSVGGFYHDMIGHSHLWNAGASGSNTWKAKLHFDHGGSINESLGNYVIEKIEYNYTLIKYFRKVFSQDGSNIWEMDYNAWTRKLHLPVYDSFEGKWLMGFCVDAGDYWSTNINTVPNSRGGRAPAYATVRKQSSDWVGGLPVYVQVPLNIQWSSCTLPSKETVHSPWFGGGGPTHDPVSGYEIVLDHMEMLTKSDNRFIQQSVYSPTLGESIAIPTSLEYFQEEISPGWKEGDSFEVKVEEADSIEIPNELQTSETGSKYITSLIGSRLVPYFRVTYRDMNDNVHINVITETELYGIENFSTAEGSVFPAIDFTSCENL